MKKTHVQINKQAFDISISMTMLAVATEIFRSPNTERTVTEIAKDAGISKSSASNAISKLRDAGLVNVVDLGAVYRIRANTENQAYKGEKIAANLLAVVRSGLVGFLVERFRTPKCIVLFGSFRTGEDGEGSDIDIAVEVPESHRIEVMHFPEFKEFERHAGRNVAVHVFNRNEIDANLFVNIANGIVLYGFLEVKK